MASLPLAQAFARIPDPRDRRGRQHPPVAMLCLTTVAVLAGGRSISAVAPFGRDHGIHGAHARGFNRALTPAPPTCSEPFRELDVAAVEDARRTGLLARGAGGGEHLALDAKTARGSAEGEVPGVHLLAPFATAGAAVLGQLEVARTTNGHKAALRLLGVLPRAGKVITADAMFAHVGVCDTITDAGGDYILAVKDNQEQLHQDIRALFEGDATPFSPHPRRSWREDLPSVTTTNKGHGRVEKRTVTTSTWLNEYHKARPKLSQVLRAERERRIEGETTVEVSHYITSLDRDRAGAGRLGALIRAHWGIENRLPCVRDVTWGEGASRAPLGRVRGAARRSWPRCGTRPTTYWRQ